MENAHEQELQDSDKFSAHIADRLSALLGEGKIFTLPFVYKLLDAFISIAEEFRVLVVELLSKRRREEELGILDEFLGVYVKSLDVCYAVSQALESLDFCYGLAETASAALGVAQRRRARRALIKLSSFLRLEGNYSSGRSSGGSSGSRRGIWLDVYENWSAMRQVQEMAAGPHSIDRSAVAVAVQRMSSVNAFVMWVLVAAFSAPSVAASGLPRQLASAEMAALQERAAEEVRREKRGVGSPQGMLAELQILVKCGGAAEDIERGREELAGELAEACRAMEEGIGPLRRQVRVLFHQLVRSRAEIMHFLRHLEDAA